MFHREISSNNNQLTITIHKASLTFWIVQHQIIAQLHNKQIKLSKHRITFSTHNQQLKLPFNQTTSSKTLTLILPNNSHNSHNNSNNYPSLLLASDLWILLKILSNNKHNQVPVALCLNSLLKGSNSNNNLPQISLLIWTPTLQLITSNLNRLTTASELSLNPHSQLITHSSHLQLKDQASLHSDSVLHNQLRISTRHHKIIHLLLKIHSVV